LEWGTKMSYQMLNSRHIYHVISHVLPRHDSTADPLQPGAVRTRTLGYK
jgi:hypothetical protein